MCRQCVYLKGVCVSPHNDLFGFHACRLKCSNRQNTNLGLREEEREREKKREEKKMYQTCIEASIQIDVIERFRVGRQMWRRKTITMKKYIWNYNKNECEQRACKTIKISTPQIYQHLLAEPYATSNSWASHVRLSINLPFDTDRFGRRSSQKIHVRVSFGRTKSTLIKHQNSHFITLWLRLAVLK